MRKFAFITGSLVLSFVGGFWFLAYGPPHLVPGPDWPFTEQSRKDYRPFSQGAVLTTQVWGKQTVGW